MGTAYNLIAFKCAHGGEIFSFFHAKHAQIFLCGALSAGHHFFQIEAGLDGAVAPSRTIVRLRARSFCHHLQRIPFGDGRHLDAHICLIDGADIAELTSKFSDDIACIAGKILHG